MDDLEIHQGEKVIPLEVYATPVFDEKGEIIYAITAFTDISERKQAEAERIRFTEELAEYSRTLRTKSAGAHPRTQPNPRNSQGHPSRITV
ncbi:MAG UNVERIFIED_CONTAM: PAS domain-containing protein [Microcystis novacekii LVE1205-3]|jgi:signal transduction histidine kinase